MVKKYHFQSERLGFREWSAADLPLLTAMNQSEEVMRFFPSKLTADQTILLVDRIKKHFEDHGYGFYAVDLLKTDAWIGFIGFQHVRFDSSFTPAIEIGYRLLPAFWGTGLATEGSMACLDHARENLDLKKIVSFTAKINKPSQRVMQKAGLTYQYEFDHPLLSEGDPLRAHVLYQL